MNNMPNVAVIGAGYVGLCTAASMPEHVSVHILDSNRSRIDSLEAEKCYIKEPGLEELLFSVDRSILVSTYTEDLLSETDYVAIFICVGTPSLPDGGVDLSAVHDVFDMISRCKRVGRNTVVVIRSTVPPGTTRSMQARLEMEKGEDNCPIVCHNPEFFQQGSAVNDIKNSSRNVYGVVDYQSMDHFWEMASIIDQSKDVIGKVMDVYLSETTELAKYANNAALSVRISMANELSRIAKKVGANYESVAHIIGKDPRIGDLFLKAGTGFGGSCLPKDLKGLLSLGVDCPTLDGALTTNKDIEDNLTECIVKTFTPVIALGALPVLLLDGVAFKRGTDDTRNSVIVSALSKALVRMPDVKVVIVDPLVDTVPHELRRVSEIYNGGAVQNIIGCISFHGMPLYPETVSILSACDKGRKTPVLVCNGHEITLNEDEYKVTYFVG